MRTGRTLCLLLVAMVWGPRPEAGAEEPDWMGTGRFHWTSSPAWIGPDLSAAEPEVALKDPSVVRHGGRWHLFATHRLASGRVNMQYLAFDRWEEAGRVPRHTLDFHGDYHCAPQVFFYTPHGRWYLVFQLADESRALKFGPWYCTTETIEDPGSWSKPAPMMESLPEGGGKTKWIDFWVICDAEKAHLFYTSDDGHFWRRETRREDFPVGWGKPVLLLEDTKEELFEASCTYKLKGMDRYLTLIEAIGPEGRYYKAWLADRLEGPWEPLASSREKPFAAVGRNVAFPGGGWTTSISHGELVRSGIDEFLEIDPVGLEFVYQGVDAEGYRGNRYGSIPWKLGVLKLDADRGGSDEKGQ